MKNLFTLNFWLNSRPGELIPLMQYFFYFLIAVLLIGGLVFLVFKRNNPKSLYRNVWESLVAFGFTNGLIGLLLLFFTYELIPFLSARFWFLVWFIEMGLWAYFTYKKAKAIPLAQENREAEKRLKQYIP